MLWRQMTLDDIPQVLAMERVACPHVLHAWSEDNYRSSLSSGYWLRVGCDPQGRIIAVCVAMFGVDELHLLNIAVARERHGQGLACWILDELVTLCQAQDLSTIWLEVRPSNERALALYRWQGYVDVGVRKHYYPASTGREDALVMKREVPHVALD
jgi:ribosomal-protein-alanine N-acetyltransferase